MRPERPDGTSALLSGAHKDGTRIAQLCGGYTIWFKPFGVEGMVDRERAWRTPAGRRLARQRDHRRAVDTFEWTQVHARILDLADSDPSGRQ